MKTKKILIARCINNITINPFEYVLDSTGDAIQFNSIKEAKDFLKKNGIKKFNGIHFVNEEV
jgi:hypothetical protein